jgi:glucose/arabinose dehydrogenase
MLACGSKSQPSPPATNPAPAQTVTASNRLGWDQAAADAVELATIRYAIYVDGVRSEMTDVTCATAATNGKYPCSARLPAMAPGPHLLELSAFVVADGNVLESPKSSGIQVIFTGSAPSKPESRSPAPGVSGSAEHTRTAGTTRAASGAVDFVSDGLEQVSDLAFTADGRMFVAERTGRIRIVRDGTLLPMPALEVERDADVTDAPAAATRGAGAVLSIAIDPQFARTHHVYVLATTASSEGTLSFLLARYREAGDTLADRAVLLHDVPAASPDPAGALRFGPDGKLYVALDAAGDSRLSGDLASPNGKVLRLNGDGTTPDDQAAASPLYSSPYHSPRGLGWDEDAGILWIVDAGAEGGARLNAVGLSAGGRQKRGVTKASLALPQPDEPSALLFVDDSVLVGSARGVPLVRGRVDANDPTRIVQTEALLQDTIDGVQALAIGPDGAVYFATADAVGRLSLR